MSTRRKKRRQKQSAQGFRDCKDGQRCPGSVDRLAFKYMEMCKVDSSTDSGSDTSPRWSDTSTKGGVPTRHEGGAVRKMLSFTQKPAGRYHLPALDPYDGSSEDSDVFEGGPRAHRQGGCSRMRCRGWRVVTNASSLPKEAGKLGARASVMVQLSTDVQMKSSSDSEVRAGHIDMSSLVARLGETPTDSGVNTESSICTPGLAREGVTPVPQPKISCSRSQAGPYRPHPKSPGSPDGLGALPKRKLYPLGAEVGERGMKKQRFVEMEVGHLTL